MAHWLLGKAPRKRGRNGLETVSINGPVKRQTPGASHLAEPSIFHHTVYSSTPGSSNLSVQHYYYTEPPAIHLPTTQDEQIYGAPSAAQDYEDTAILDFPHPEQTDLPEPEEADITVSEASVRRQFNSVSY